MSHLTLGQRYTIEVLKAKNYKQNEIAEAIGKHKSVVSRELKRNSDKRNGAYKADLAERKYCKGQETKPKHICFTSDIKSYVINGLNNDYSPEQISGRAKLEGVICVSHERIYQFIWADKKLANSLQLYEHLRHQGRKYRQGGNGKGSRGIIKNRQDIDQRPAIVEEKSRFGDLEIDTIIGKNHQGALLTINDRATGLVWIRRLDSKHEEPLSKASIEALKPLKNEFKTITSDNGKEFAGHQKIAHELEIDFYFAKPYHSWERGANRNDEP